jgi:hypothetical protein
VTRRVRLRDQMARVKLWADRSAVAAALARSARAERSKRTSETGAADGDKRGPAIAPPDDIDRYVTAFKTSSDHTRYALYVVLVMTVFVAIAQYNIQDWSWQRRRLEAYYGTEHRGEGEDSEERLRAIARRLQRNDTARLRVVRDEYLRQFQARSVLSVSPIPGASIDVNDLGTVGGIALSLLLLVLFVAVSREHENLRLALFKVRRLAQCEADPADGNSRANLLYHALAMTQVLSSPPTLAIWRGRGRLHGLGPLLFVPALVHSWVVWTDLHTGNVADVYGVNFLRIIILELIFVIWLWVLSVRVLLDARAMAAMWERAFFSINPSLQHVAQMAWWQWLKLRGRRRPDWLAARVANEIVDSFRISDLDSLAKTSVVVTLQLPVPRPGGRLFVSRKLVDKMRRQLCDQGKENAIAECVGCGQFEQLERFRAEENHTSLTDGRWKWTVRGTWTYTRLRVSDKASRR